MLQVKCASSCGVIMHRFRCSKNVLDTRRHTEALSAVLPVDGWLACHREDTFLKEHLGMVAVASSQAVQLEVDRFSLATSLLLTGAKAHWGLPCHPAPPSPPDVLGTDPPEAVKPKFEGKVSPTP